MFSWAKNNSGSSLSIPVLANHSCFLNGPQETNQKTMLGIIKITVAVVVLLATRSTCIFVFRQDPLDTLNKFLTDHENSDSLKANIEAAKLFLHQKQDKPKLTGLATSLTALDKINDSNLCSLETSRLVSDAFEALRGLVKKPLKDKRRVARLIGELAERRARQCFYELTEQFCRPNECDIFDYHRNNLNKFIPYLHNDCPVRHKSGKLNTADCANRNRHRDLNSPLVPNRLHYGLSSIRGHQQLVGVTKEQVGEYLEHDLYGNCAKFMERPDKLDIIKDALSMLSTVRVRDELFGRDTFKTRTLLNEVTNYVLCERLAITDKQKLINNVFWWQMS